MSKNLKDSNTIKVVIEGDDLSLDFINEYYNKSEIDDIKNTITDSIDGISTENNKKANISETVNKMDFTFDSKDNKIKLDLKDKNNKSLSSKAIELPFKKTVVSAVYDKTSKSIVLTQMSGEKITISIAELITGLATNSDMNTALSKKVDIIEGKSLSKNDFTDELKQKLDGISSKAQVNKIETIKVNGTAVSIDSNKAVNIDISDKANASEVYSKTESDKRYIQDSNYVHTDNNYSNDDLEKVKKIDSIGNEADDLFGTLPTKDISGNYIKIDDSKDCRILALNISGGHKQIISNGLNKINQAKLKRNMDINLRTGTEVTGGNRTIYTEFIEIEPEESYFFKRPFAQGPIALRYYDSEYNYLGSASKGTNESAIFIPTNDYATTKYIKFCDEANTLLEGYMFAKSSVPIPYEPYTSEKSMPNCQNESAITLVNKITLHTFNKNILNGKSLNYSSNNISSDYDNGVLKFKGTISTNWANLTPSVKINAKAGRYVFRRKNINYRLTLRLYANDLVKSFDYTLDNGQSSMNITTTVDFARYYLFTSQYTSGDKLDIEDMVQFEAINTDTNIVQAKNQDIVLELKNQELFDTDSVVIDKNGNYSLEICHKKIVLDGINKAFTYAQPINDKYMFKFTAPDKASDIASGNTEIAISNHLKMVSGTAIEALTNNTEGFWNEKGNNFYAILPFDTLEVANNWLKTNNLIVYYKSETKEVIDLGTLSELPKTYNGTSYIYSETNIDSTELSLEYVSDLKKAIDTTNTESNVIERGIVNHYALTPDYREYTIRFPLFSTSQISVGEKLNDNKDKYINLATDTVREETNYSEAHDTVDCNAYIDENGIKHITALKGMKNYKETGEVDVYTLWRTRYFKSWIEGNYIYFSMTFYPKEGFTVTPLAINPDGTISPWFLIAKYTAGTINKQLYSSKGLTPACWLGASPYTNTMSHNDGITKAKKRGQFYSIGYFPEYTLIALDCMIRLGTKNIQDVLKGNTVNDKQYLVSKTEENVSRVILTNVQANNIDVNSYVSVGDDGTGSVRDRARAELHNIAFCVKVISKVQIDDNYTALNLDCEPFTTTKTTLVSTMWERSGYSDNILGRYGSVGSNTNGRHGAVWNGVEFLTGISEVVGNAFMDITEDGSRDVYFTNNSRELTTNLADSLNKYQKSNYRIPASGDVWKYITEVGFDLKNGLFIPTDFGKSGSSSATGYGDAYFASNATSGQREFILCGSLATGLAAGLWYLGGNYALSNGNWDFWRSPFNKLRWG